MILGFHYDCYCYMRRATSSTGYDELRVMNNLPTTANTGPLGYIKEGYETGLDPNYYKPTRKSRRNNCDKNNNKRKRHKHSNKWKEILSFVLDRHHHHHDRLSFLMILGLKSSMMIAVLLLLLMLFSLVQSKYISQCKIASLASGGMQPSLSVA